MPTNTHIPTNVLNLTNSVSLPIFGAFSGFHFKDIYANMYRTILVSMQTNAMNERSPAAIACLTAISAALLCPIEVPVSPSFPFSQSACSGILLSKCIEMDFACSRSGLVQVMSTLLGHSSSVLHDTLTTNPVDMRSHVLTVYENVVVLYEGHVIPAAHLFGLFSCS